MILLIDNYDSFVFNVEQYLKEMTDEQVKTVRNDKITLEEIKKFCHQDQNIQKIAEFVWRY